MPVAIGGMHRSGTSMVARLLNLVGLNLGPESDLFPALPDNPAGFWEKKAFVAINNAIFAALGGTYLKPPRMVPGWEASAALDPLRNRALEAIAQFTGVQRWGWKDPRNSLTFPFWRSLVPGLQLIVCLRHPAEVVDSMCTRSRQAVSSRFGRFDSAGRAAAALFGSWAELTGAIGSRKHAEALWVRYNEDAIERSAPAERIVTHFERYHEAPQAELRRVVAFVGLSPTPETFARALATVAQDLRHNVAEDQSEAALPAHMRDLYEQLLFEAEERTPA